MVNLIDKERAYTALKHEQYTHGLSFSAEAFEKAARIIDQMPTIEAEPVNRWIPVEDALPEIGYSVLVTRQTESNTRYIKIASRQDDCWIDNTDKYLKPNPHPVIAWMPMPDAYEPPKEDET